MKIVDPLRHIQGRMDSLHLALAKFRWSLHHRGLFGTLRAAALSLAPNRSASQEHIIHPFDTQHGVDTGGMFTAVDLASGHPNDLLGTGYCGIPPSRFKYILERWIDAPPEGPVSAYSFVDVGCGKGRALMLAAALPFREVIGVELNPGLAQIATHNLGKWRRAQQPTSPIRVVCQDATEFAFPETPCLIYLYNPFAEPVLVRLIEQIERSFSANPRALDILYYNPGSDKLFARHPSYRQLWSGPVPISSDDAAADPFASSNEICSLYRRIAH